MPFRVDLCEGCAGKLRAILAKEGEKNMARAIGRVLCTGCRSRIPGYRPGQRLVSRLKEPAS